jgi:hypothetical protein
MLWYRYGYSPCHPAAVRGDEVAVGDETLGDLPSPFGVVAKRHTPAKKVHVVVHLLMGDLVQLALLGRGYAGARVEGAGEVAVVAVAADDAGVEGDEFVFAQAAVARLLEPGVGARAG